MRYMQPHSFLCAIYANTRIFLCNICKHSVQYANTRIFPCNISKHFVQYMQALISFCAIYANTCIFLYNICKHQAITLCLLRTTPLATTSPAQMTKHIVHNVQGAQCSNDRAHDVQNCKIAQSWDKDNVHKVQLHIEQCARHANVDLQLLLLRSVCCVQFTKSIPWSYFNQMFSQLPGVHYSSFIEFHWGVHLQNKNTCTIWIFAHGWHRHTHPCVLAT